MSSTGNKVAILYAELPTMGLGAIALSRIEVDQIGSSLDKIIPIFQKAGIPMDHYDIMNLAQNPQGWVNAVKSMSNIT
jgi:hypothetical protein